jgi:glycosyltransferase involved in cell wall biosynthesis
MNALLATTGGMLLGGSTTFLLNLGRALLARGDQLPVVCLSGENEMAADFAAAGVTVECLPWRRLIYEDRIGLAWRLAAAQQPQAVLACLGSESFEVLRSLPAQVVRLGIIQSDDPGPYKMARHYAPWLDGMVGVSETICRRLREDSAYAGLRVECIPYGIDFGPAVVRTARDPAKPLRIIYVGRVSEIQKRVSRLIELARTLQSRGEHFEFTFAGSGSELDATRDVLRNFPNVRFLGDVMNSEIAALLRSHDVFVLLSDFEGLPLSLLEAMGQGVVPVVSDLESGIRQVVTPETGIRVPIGDVPAAAAAISVLAREPLRLAGLSTAASQLAHREYSAARMAERYLQLVAELATGQPAWPADVRVPAPLLVSHGWMYQGLPRRVRRLLKRVLGAVHPA